MLSYGSLAVRFLPQRVRESALSLFGLSEEEHSAVPLDLLKVLYTRMNPLLWESSFPLYLEEGRVQVGLGALVYGLHGPVIGECCCGADGPWLRHRVGGAAGTA